MKPDFEKAALLATETLIKYNIDAAPVFPLSILKRMPGVLVLSFSELSNRIDIERKKLITLFGLENQDAVTSIQINDGKLRYVVAYNQLLPLNMLQRALAQELGHVLLRHDESIPEEIRIAEAKCFTKHLLCPRALVHAILGSGEPLTVEAFGSITGCYGRCQAMIRQIPGVHIPAEMNRKIKDQFSLYIDNFLSYQSFLVQKDTSPVVDLGTFMDGYTE